ncbi:MAG: hypothetical protein R2710_07675 [Acidimicrobiales bacterium]
MSVRSVRMSANPYSGTGVTGVVEHAGNSRPPLPDMVPPPHWRLEAIVAVERPRQLDVRVAAWRSCSTVTAPTSGRSRSGPVAPPARWYPTGGRPIGPIAAFWEDTGPRFSPDGSTVAYTNGDAIWLTNGGPARKLCDAGSPVWIDDARLIVEIDRPSPTQPHGRTVLGVVAIDSGWITPLAELDGDLGEVAVSPDGSQATAVHSPRTDLNASRIVTISLDPTALGVVDELDGEPAMHDSNPSWSPDGSTVIFRSESSGWYEAYLWDVTTGDRRRLTDAEADLGEFAWSEHGLAAIRTRHGVSDLVAIDPVSGAVQLIAAGGVWSAPTWIGSGRLLAVHEAADVAPRLVEVSWSGAAGAAPTIVDRVRPTGAGSFGTPRST